ncbi:tetratricopeptide repeat protein [Pseudoalteromonas xiamenensis]
MRNYRYFMVALILLLTCDLAKSQEDRSASDILREAEDYLNVLPSRSYELLHSDVDLSTFQASQLFRWYIAKMRAAVSTNNLIDVELDIELLFKLKHEDYFKENAWDVFRITGIVLRKLGFWNESKLSFECALYLTQTDKEKLGILISLGILERHLDQDEMAKIHYKKAGEIAAKLKNERALASVYNNLGTLELDQGNIEKAEEYYRSALVAFQDTNKRSGNITAGTNLLLIFAIQKNTLNFQRLFSPINTFVENYPDESKKALMYWLSSADKQNQGAAIDAETKKQLTKSFEQLESIKMKILINKYLAPRFGMVFIVPEQPEVTPKKSLAWLSELPSCFQLKAK